MVAAEDASRHAEAMTWWHQLRTLLACDPSAEAGEQGERIAARWLAARRGFSVVARNWRNPEDRREEIDLVCREGDVLVFVEVKTRASGALVPGYHAVNERKRRVLRRGIAAYLQQLREKPLTFRFDVVEVTTGTCDVLHFENVPLFPKHFRV